MQTQITMTPHRALAWSSLPLLAACSSRPPPPDWPVSTPAQLCADRKLERDDFCMPVDRLERWMSAPDLRVTHVATAAQGISAPRKLRIVTPEGIAFSVKFKPVPADLDNLNNSPRRELAAYEIQKLFLDEDDYVVPPTMLRCLPIAGPLTDLEPFDGSGCALGVMAYWVENVGDEEVVSEEEWEEDPTYRDALGKLNVFTVLIGHQDDMGANFVRSLDDDRPRLLSIDNGLSLGAMGVNPFQIFTSGWSSVKVVSIPSETAQRLQQLTAKDFDALGVVAQLRREGDLWVSVEPLDPPFDPAEGVRRREGNIQLGLTAEEITGVHTRAVELAGALRSEELESEPPPDLDD